MKMLCVRLVILLVTPATFGCKAADTGSSRDAQVYAECRNPRPQICAQGYEPVCGLRDTGVRCVTTPCPSTEPVTYANACLACMEDDVLGYEPGQCIDDDSTEE